MPTATKTTAEEVREAEANTAAHHLATRLVAIQGNLEDLEKDPTLAAEGLEDQELADAIADIQDARARLQNVERDLTTALGRRLGKTTGNLGDGRQYTLSRAQDRKEWDHSDWKRDARRKVTEAITSRFQTDDLGPMNGDLVDTETGEAASLAEVIQTALAQVQEVHGSTAPRSTALRSLGLYASDYCTSTPNGWRFTALKPTTPTSEDSPA